jgi:sugar fermentation stimulation protein A
MFSYGPIFLGGFGVAPNEGQQGSKVKGLSKQRRIKTVNPWPNKPEKIIKARFFKRPNRFLIHCVHDRLGEVQAHLPNSGRLWELLLPGAIVYLKPATGPSAKTGTLRKTRFTAMAVERQGCPVFLHTHDTNHVARYLIERDLIAPLKGATVARAEVPMGRNRFDFLLRSRGKPVYLEVKSCTLFGNGVAMFPDAVTERGRRHLLELADMGRRGMKTVVLFLVHSSRVRWFMPEYHTDLAFSTALLEARQDVQIIAAALGWQKDLTLDKRITSLKIPWPYLEKEIKDRGSYLLVVRLDSTKRLNVGRLGKLTFRKGYYLYVGSAMMRLTGRMKRHERKEKKPHWHIDYLTAAADRVFAMAIRSSQRLECGIARAVSAIAQKGPAGFGSSDCLCETHLFWSAKDPLGLRAFHDMVQRFRMASPGPAQS